jgi:protein translocase subunit secF
MFKQNIDFLGKRKIALVFSSLLIVVSITSFVVNGMKLGIDFTGGTLVEVGYQQAADLTVLRAALDKDGFADATVQKFRYD